jgi:hypothetical protein
MAAATTAKGSVVGMPKRIADSPMTTAVAMVVGTKLSRSQVSNEKARCAIGGLSCSVRFKDEPHSAPTGKAQSGTAIPKYSLYNHGSGSAGSAGSRKTPFSEGVFLSLCGLPLLFHRFTLDKVGFRRNSHGRASTRNWFKNPLRALPHRRNCSMLRMTCEVFNVNIVA